MAPLLLQERLSPAIIYSPHDLSTKIITQKTQHLISAITSAFEFLELLGAPSTDDAGRARLLDGASAPGPSSWLARVPSAPKFRFLESTVDPISARAADLLACPPHLRLRIPKVATFVRNRIVRSRLISH